MPRLCKSAVVVCFLAAGLPAALGMAEDACDVDGNCKEASQTAALLQSKSVYQVGKVTEAKEYRLGEGGHGGEEGTPSPSLPSECVDSTPWHAAEGIVVNSCAEVAGFCDHPEVAQYCCATCNAPCEDNNTGAIEAAARHGESISSCAEVVEFCFHEEHFRMTHRLCCATCKGAHRLAEGGHGGEEGTPSPSPPSECVDSTPWHAAEGIVVNSCEEVAGFCDDPNVAQPCCATCNAPCEDNNTGAIEAAARLGESISSCAEIVKFCFHEEHFRMTHRLCCATCKDAIAGTALVEADGARLGGKALGLSSLVVKVRGLSGLSGLSALLGKGRR